MLDAPSLAGRGVVFTGICSGSTKQSHHVNNLCMSEGYVPLFSGFTLFNCRRPVVNLIAMLILNDAPCALSLGGLVVLVAQGPAARGALRASTVTACTIGSKTTNRVTLASARKRVH